MGVLSALRQTSYGVLEAGASLRSERQAWLRSFPPVPDQRSEVAGALVDIGLLLCSVRLQPLMMGTFQLVTNDRLGYEESLTFFWMEGLSPDDF